LRANETVRLLGLQVEQETDALEQALARVMEREMAGMAAIAEGRTEEGVARLREATVVEDTLPKPIGRPYPVKGSHELLGEILLGLKRFSESAHEFRRSLDRVANRSLSVLGLARATRELGDRETARELYRQFLTNWRLADAELPEIEEARRFVEAAGAASAPTPPARPGVLLSVAPWMLGASVAGLGIVWWRRRRASHVASSGAPRRRRPTGSVRRPRR
jgi:tetratricopeptide (TPR) repeat protein